MSIIKALPVGLENGFCMALVQKHFLILSKHLLLCPSLVPIWMGCIHSLGWKGLLFWLSLFLPSSRCCLSIDLSPLFRECTWVRVTSVLIGAHCPPILSGAACEQRWPALSVVRSHSETGARRQSSGGVIWPPWAFLFWPAKWKAQTRWGLRSHPTRNQGK